VKVLSDRPVKFQDMKKMYHKNMQTAIMLYDFDLKDFLPFAQIKNSRNVEVLHTDV
jgi:hypothetical protein